MDLSLDLSLPTAPLKGGGVSDELLIVAGQSNALGLGASTVPTEVAAIDPNRVKIWNGSAFVGYVAGTTSEPTGASATKWGPEAQYAIRWLAANPSGVLYIVKRAVSGSEISTWLAGASNFDNLTTWLTAAKAALTRPATVKVMMVQGESDAIVDQALADAYQAKLVQFLADARAFWGNAGTRIGLMRIYNANMTYRATVRAAQKTVAYADPLTMMVNTDDQTLVDTYHYNNAGLIALGDRFYTAMATGVGYEYEDASSLPTLTSNSAPAGYGAAASSEFSGSFAAYKAFDKSLDESTGRWATANGLSVATLDFTAPAPIALGAFTFAAYSFTGFAPTTLVLSGSMDGVNFTTIATYSGLTWSASEIKLFEIAQVARAKYKVHRWTMGGVANGYTAREVTPLQCAALTEGGDGSDPVASVFADGTDGFYHNFSTLAKLWKDTAATSPVTTAGDSIARSDDSSPRGRNATQATGTAQPKYQTGGLAQFDGSDTLATAVVPAAAITLMAKLNVSNAGAGIIGANNASFANQCSLITAMTTGVLAGALGSTGSVTITSGIDIRGQKGVAALVADNGAWRLYWQGVQVASGSYSGALTTTNALNIGSINNNGAATAFATGDGYHVLAIKKALTAAEIAAITDKWGTA